MRNTELDLMRNIESRINRIEKSALSTEKSAKRIAESVDKILAEMTKPVKTSKKVADAIGIGAGIAGILGIVVYAKNFFGG